LELTVVTAVVGVLASVAAVRFQPPSGQSLTLQTDQLRRDLSNVQMLAISRSLRLTLSAHGDHYAVQTCESAACIAPTSLTNPATGSAFVVPMQHGVQISSASALIVDSLGRPASGSEVIQTDPAVRFELSVAGRSTRVDVAPLTGRARVTD
jgi:type II secretory pathway pseudopilin PulG